jgi:hypothetical protein
LVTPTPAVSRSQSTTYSTHAVMLTGYFKFLVPHDTNIDQPRGLKGVHGAQAATMGLASKLAASGVSGAGPAPAPVAAPALIDLAGAPSAPPAPFASPAPATAYPPPATAAYPAYPPVYPNAHHPAPGHNTGYNANGYSANGHSANGHSANGHNAVHNPVYPGGPAHPVPNATAGFLDSKIRGIVRANGLSGFYDEARIQVVLRKVTRVNFDAIAAKWRITKELACDLAPLALYDIVFFCDDSGSMAFEDQGERIEDLKLILGKVADVVADFDDDGVSVRFINSSEKGDGLRGAADALRVVSRVPFSGGTPLGTNFAKKVVEPFVNKKKFFGLGGSDMDKPVLAIVITDGEPAGEPRDTFVRVLQDAKNALAGTKYGPKALAVQIAQVGKDARTTRFLAEIDGHPGIGDIVDCTSYYELEAEEFARKGVTLTPELWLLKMCMGAVDPEYDSRD